MELADRKATSSLVDAPLVLTAAAVPIHLPPPPPGLLILEASANRLRREGHMRVVDQLRETLRASEEGGHLRTLRYPINDLPDIQLGLALAKFGRFDGVILVGHGGADGCIEAAPGVPLPWEFVGQALAALEPRAILAISCYGAAAGPTKALFDAIPSLEAVMGSPIPLTSKQAQLATLEFFARIYRRAVTPELSAMMMILNTFLTGGVVWTRTREEYAKKTATELSGEDAIAALVKLFLGASGLDDLEKALRRRRRLTKPSSPARQTM